MTAPDVSTAKRALVAQLHAQNRSVAQIAANTGLSEQAVRAALDAHATERLRRPGAVPPPAPAGAREAPPGPAHLEVTHEDLLAWAAQHPLKKVSVPAARVLALLAQLREAHDADSATRQLRADVERLSAQLAEARERLREVEGGRSSDRSGSPVRTWLAEHGHACPAVGRIPARLQALYDQAHPGGAS